MRFEQFCLVSLCLALGSCATTKTEKIADRTLTRDYQIDGIRWQGDRTLAVLFKVIEQDEKVTLCGAYTTDSRKGVGGTTFNDLALQAMSVTIDDKLIVKDLTYLNKLPFPNQGIRPNGQATCILSDIPWQPKYGNSIRPMLVKGKTSFVIRN